MSSLIKSDVFVDSWGTGGSWTGVLGICASWGGWVTLGRVVAFGGSEGVGDDLVIGLVGVTGLGTEGRDSLREDSRDFSGVGRFVGSF